ncbi:NAD-dependent epimerase/dehydratase family protein [Bacteriovoracales bacterium]|nr:NAD-dependent epimerase/dehydratase family protein [Bacteriovoracales bacterium]
MLKDDVENFGGIKMNFKSYCDLKIMLQNKPQKWLLTGAAGFIGSNLLQELLELDQKVVAIDNFSNGLQSNLDEVKKSVGERWRNLQFIEGDFCQKDIMLDLCDEVDYVLHQGALGSVPRSINDPLTSNRHNVEGQLTILTAAKEKGVKKVVFASSSSVYGDHPDLPKMEEKIGEQLSPYAVSKYVNELYASVFYKNFGLSSAGLRYFNVFGRRQSPKGPYAAVIPIWIQSMIRGEDVCIFGDGKTSRDFCYVRNVIEANIQAACAKVEGAYAYNIALSDQTSLNDLFSYLKEFLSSECGINYNKDPVYKDFRKGDVRHSRANIEKAQKDFKYNPEVRVEDGLRKAIKWYVETLR